MSAAARLRRPVVMAAPTFGLALSATAIGTYLPLIARHLGASTPISGGLPAIQGAALVALSIPFGMASDRLGRHRGFLAFGGLLGAVALTVVALAQTVAMLIAGAGLFFCAYVLAYEPYRAALLNLASEARVATAQSVQAGWRTAGSSIALFAGGALAGIWLSAPILLAAACLTGCAVLGRLALPATHPDRTTTRPSTLQLLREQPIVMRSLLVAGLSEFALAIVRAFGLLYVTGQLRLSTGCASLVFAGFTALGAMSAIGIGPIAERLGVRRVMLTCAALYASGLAGVALTTQTPLLAGAATAAALGGGGMTTLSYALGATSIPASLRGRLTGATTAARGLGLLLGPMLAAAALEGGGFEAAFCVAAVAVAVSVAALATGRTVTSRKPRLSTGGQRDL